MIYISKDRQIHVVWSIFRGTSDVHEDFSRALVKVFLIGNYEKYLLEAVAEGGNLVFDIPQGLPEGAYSLEAIWVKNYNNLLPCSDTLTPSVDSGCRNQPLRWPFKHPHDHRFNDRCIMRSRKDFVFALTEYDSESTFYKDSGEAEIKIRSAVATYGYDGLSAYEIAVLRGDFNGTEGEYLDSLKFELEVAQEHKLGGITAVTKTDDETEEVKVDPETGRLYVKPGGGSLSVATETKLGGIKASSKTDNETVEAKIGEDGKLYVPKGGEELKAATETTLGGIKAATKTSLDTQEVKIDPVTGKLYTQPGGEGSVEIVNNPDEEDLHSIEKSADVHVLQFADKEYNASSFSGLGRVYLRKNISDGKNVLTQAMMNKANTRYIIQYDYDLDGETITMPEGCTLDFQGGSLKNGTLRGNGTCINSSLEYIFKNSFILTGSWSIDCVYPEWFGAKGDYSSSGEDDYFNKGSGTDDTAAFNAAIANAKTMHVNKVQLSSKNYYIPGTITIDNPNVTMVIQGTIMNQVWETAWLKSGGSKIISNNNTVFSIEPTSRVCCFRYIQMFNKSGFSAPVEQSTNIAILVQGNQWAHPFEVYSCKFWGYYKAIDINTSSQYVIYNFCIKYNGFHRNKYCVYFEDHTSSEYTRKLTWNFHFNDNWATGNFCCIRGAFSHDVCEIRNNTFDNVLVDLSGDEYFIDVQLGYNVHFVFEDNHFEQELRKIIGIQYYALGAYVSVIHNSIHGVYSQYKSEEYISISTTRGLGAGLVKIESCQFPIVVNDGVDISLDHQCDIYCEAKTTPAYIFTNFIPYGKINAEKQNFIGSNYLRTWGVSPVGEIYTINSTEVAGPTVGYNIISGDNKVLAFTTEFLSATEDKPFTFISYYTENNNVSFYTHTQSGYKFVTTLLRMQSSTSDGALMVRYNKTTIKAKQTLFTLINYVEKTNVFGCGQYNSLDIKQLTYNDIVLYTDRMIENPPYRGYMINFVSNDVSGQTEEMVWNGEKWLYLSETSPINTSGTSQQRPQKASSLPGIPMGFMFFDTTLGKPIFWDSTNEQWVDSTGAVVQ